MGTESIKTQDLSALSLAYLGDAVYELCVRSMLVKNNELNPRDLSNHAKSFVSAKAQAAFYHKVYSMLTETEQAVLKRGRNLNHLSRAKNASVSDYRHATGLEVLFGYLYAENKYGRLQEIFKLCVSEEVGYDRTE